MLHITQDRKAYLQPKRRCVGCSRRTRYTHMSSLGEERFISRREHAACSKPKRHFEENPSYRGGVAVPRDISVLLPGPESLIVKLLMPVEFGLCQEGTGLVLVEILKLVRLELGITPISTCQDKVSTDRTTFICVKDGPMS